MEENQNEKLIQMLTDVKTEFIKNKKELQYSIRKDIVAAQLRDIIINSTDYEDLKNNINNYCEDLIQSNKE